MYVDLLRQRECKVCLSNLATVLFLPCGHLSACPACAPHLQVRNDSSLTLIGKSWETHPNIFFEILVFRVVTQTDFWKTHPCEFHECLFSFDNIGSRARPSSGKLIHIWFNHSVWLMTRYYKNWKCIHYIEWMSFPEIGLGHEPKFA